MGLITEGEYWPSRAEVLEKLFAVWQPEVRIEKIPLTEAKGRIAAEDIQAVFGLPVVRASAMDGIGVESVMFAGGRPDTSRWRMGVELQPDRYR